MKPEFAAQVAGATLVVSNRATINRDLRKRLELTRPQAVAGKPLGLKSIVRSGIQSIGRMASAVVL